jgi:hypothetical protein
VPQPYRAPGPRHSIYSDFAQNWVSLSVVMPAHNASKTRVNALVWRASTSCFLRAAAKKDVDGRDKPG